MLRVLYILIAILLVIGGHVWLGVWMLISWALAIVLLQGVVLLLSTRFGAWVDQLGWKYDRWKRGR